MTWRSSLNLLRRELNATRPYPIVIILITVYNHIHLKLSGSSGTQDLEAAVSIILQTERDLVRMGPGREPTILGIGARDDGYKLYENID
jgi:hypothetical protein